jgi:hypothetical protein
MNSSKPTIAAAALLAFGLALSAPVAVAAQEIDPSIAACLKAWGDHPFGNNPQFKTLGTSAKLFGIGSGAADTVATSSPALVLVNPIFNVMGETTIDLLNPNGWYCLGITVSILGKVDIRAHCKAQLAEASDGIGALGKPPRYRDLKNLNVTVAGSVAFERPCN